MKLIEEIIEILSSKEGKLSDALIKTKVLLYKIGQKDLVGWVNNELNGYPENEVLPKYRILNSQVLANLANMAWQATAHPIPIGHLTKEQRDSLEFQEMRQSLAVIEKYAEQSDGSLQHIIPMEWYGLLEKNLASGFRIQKAWCEVQIVNFAEILIQVRSRLLDFIMELNERVPGDLDDEQIKNQTDKFDAANLFNNAIFGDNTTIVVGTGNVQQVTNTITKGDFESLSRALKKYDIAEEDIQSLSTAIDSDKDQVDHKNRKFGPAVKTWIQVMLSKSVEAIWQIPIGAAGSLLSTALNNYYGWF